MGDNSISPIGYDYFVSFADDAKEWVYGVLVPKLGRTGKRFALESSDPTGQFWLRDLQEQIEKSHTILLILSPQYLTSERKELIQQMALLKIAEKRQWRVIPILLKSIERELVLRLIDGIDLTKNYESEERLDALLNTSPIVDEPDLNIPPYPGMVAFKETDASRFFGREEEIDQCIRSIRNEGILVLIGASGCGKSSLARAGVIPKLKTGHQFSVKDFRPRDQSLMDWLTQVASLINSDSQAACNYLFGNASQEKPILLFIDQFEELFSLEGNDVHRAGLDDKAKQLLNYLALIRAYFPELYLLITVRADFYPQLALCQPYINFDKYLRRVNALGRKELTAAITQPALRKGVFIAELLVERLVSEAGDDAGILPFVQETMRELWAKRSERYIGLDAYENLGGKGVSGLRASIATKADAAYKQLPSDIHRLIAKRIFIRLVQFGEGQPDTKRQQLLNDLKSYNDRDDLFDKTLEHLISEKYRLLVITHEDFKEDQKIEIVHEVLITSWVTLKEWIGQLREIEGFYRYLKLQSEKWSDDFKKNLGLLSNKQLKLFKNKWIFLKEYGVSPQVEEYWKASINYNKKLIYREGLKYYLVVISFSFIIYVFWLEYSQYVRSTVISDLGQAKIDQGILPLLLEDDSGVKSKEVRINDFLIDKYEVSNDSLCKCTQVFKCSVGNREEVCNPKFSKMPVNNISLANAQDFCEWIGRRLPLEVEWEMAAKNIDNIISAREVSKNIIPVNDVNLEKTKDDVYGLYTNVSEWTLSGYDENVFFSQVFWSKENPIDGVTLKGGDFSYGEIKPYYFRTDIRSSIVHERIGFRCVTNKKPKEIIATLE